MIKAFKYLIFLCLTNAALAQSPQMMSYQAVIRGNDNKLLSNRSIGAQFSLLSKSTGGPVIFLERQTTMSNDNGLLSLEIGNGNAFIGNFSTIDWSKGPYFLKTEYDPSGGTNYSISSISQLLSVPYALYAQKSGHTFSHQIGEFFDGGIIFHLFKDKNGEEHGLIVSLEDIAVVTNWSNQYEQEIGQDAKSLWNGSKNTFQIINQAGHFESAANYCDQYFGGGKTDWYLPSIDELNLLFQVRYTINRAVESDNNPITKPISHLDYYWSSTEAKANTAFAKHFATGDDHTNGKFVLYSVRAIRAF